MNRTIADLTDDVDNRFPRLPARLVVPAELARPGGAARDLAYDVRDAGARERRGQKRRRVAERRTASARRIFRVGSAHRRQRIHISRPARHPSGQRNGQQRRQQWRLRR